MKIKVNSYDLIGSYEYAETERVTFFGRTIKETWFRDWRNSFYGVLSTRDKWLRQKSASYFGT